jgi:hypothetical protein
MASLNGGFVGIDYEPESATQAAVITTFNSSGTLTTSTINIKSYICYRCRWSSGGGECSVWWSGGGAGGYRIRTNTSIRWFILSSYSWSRWCWSSTLQVRMVSAGSNSVIDTQSQLLQAGGGWCITTRMRGAGGSGGGCWKWSSR